MSAFASVIQPSDRLPEPTMNPRVASVLTYVEENHNRSSCRLEEVARNLTVSRSYLSRLVLRETGLTFNRHLQLARMNTAARLLQGTALSVKEISAATGYEHVPSFDRQFRKHFRMTPGEFRRGLRI
jgi:AraC-like DNA-binding protein